MDYTSVFCVLVALPPALVIGGTGNREIERDSFGTF